MVQILECLSSGLCFPIELPSQVWRSLRCSTRHATSRRVGSSLGGLARASLFRMTAPPNERSPQSNDPSCVLRPYVKNLSDTFCSLFTPAFATGSFRDCERKPFHPYMDCLMCRRVKFRPSVNHGTPLRHSRILPRC